MALASRPAGLDNAVPSLPGSDSWLSQRNKKIRSLFGLHVLVRSSYILDVVGTFRIWSSTHMARAITVGLVTRLWLCLTVSPVRSTHDHCSLYATHKTMVIEKPSRRWRGAGLAPSNSYSATATKSKMATPRFKKSFWQANLVKIGKKVDHHEL